MFVKDHADLDIAHHQMSWADFDSLARGDGGADAIRRLRRTQRSRRLLLLRTLMDEIAKNPEVSGPFPTPEAAWDLLARVQQTAPETFDLIIAHPYTGPWIIYTKRLVGKVIVDPDCPIWIHVGHFHALAAAAAIRAGMSFEARIPVRNGEAVLPTLGTARLPVDAPWSTAEVRGDSDGVRVGTPTDTVVLPRDPSTDGPGWWGMRRLVTREVNQLRLEVRVDDLDPYRGLHEPALADRTDPADLEDWDSLLDDAWRLIVECVPTLADGFPVGFDSLVPRPEVPFRYMSGSTSETFGSAVIAKPPSAALLATAMVHEFQHSRLHALMHLVRLNEPDPSEHYYTLWRDDPRPVGGVLHGVYAFFGMTAFWRALAATDDRRTLFELAYCRTGTWQTLQELRADPALTEVGQRFVNGIAERLTPWLDEPLPEDIAALADAATTDHHAGWRLRHLRPAPDLVDRLTDAWLSGSSTSDTIPLPPDPTPTRDPDGSWPGARTELIRLLLSDLDGTQLTTRWHTVPGATPADLAYITGKPNEAITGYLAELTADPDSASPWIGLGLALSANRNTNAAHALLTYPELVRAVHREIRSRSGNAPAPDELAVWIGQIIPPPRNREDWGMQPDSHWAASMAKFSALLRKLPQLIWRRAERHQLVVEMAILVVDIRKFVDGRELVHQKVAQDGLFDALDYALSEVGIRLDECVLENRGDGALILVPSKIPRVLLVRSLPHHLCGALRRHNKGASAEAQVRLRMVIHAGAVLRHGRGQTSEAINLACRLLDSDELKSALEDSGGVLAVMASDKFYQETIRQDPESNPDSYSQVVVTVKETTAVGWIQVSS